MCSELLLKDFFRLHISAVITKEGQSTSMTLKGLLELSFNCCHINTILIITNLLEGNLVCINQLSMPKLLVLSGIRNIMLCITDLSIITHPDYIILGSSFIHTPNNILYLTALTKHVQH